MLNHSTHLHAAENDPALLRLLQQGDRAAFTTLYNRYWKSLFTVAANKLGSLPEAEEVVQDIFTDLWQRREKLTISSGFSAYLGAAVKYKVIDRLAARSRRQQYTQHLQHDVSIRNTAEDALGVQDLQRHLDKAVATLPEKCRLVFELSRNQGFSQKEISLQLGIAVKTVEAHLAKALRALRLTISSLMTMLLFFLG